MAVLAIILCGELRTHPFTWCVVPAHGVTEAEATSVSGSPGPMSSPGVVEGALGPL